MLLYIMLAYLILIAASLNTACFCNAFSISYFLPFTIALLFVQMSFVFMLCHGLLTQFVYFIYYFASCTVLLICSFS